MKEKIDKTKNKWVDFIPDKDFEECVDSTMADYEERSKLRRKLIKESTSDSLRRTHNTTDQFKTLFDIHGYGFESLKKEWKLFEISRSLEASKNRIYVEFHLQILSRVKGWTLINRTKHNAVSSARTLVNDEESIYIEIRNNQYSFDSIPPAKFEERFRHELGNPDKEIYAGYIISKGHVNGISTDFYIGDPKENKIITEISGDVIYKIVTGQNTAFYDTYKSLRQYLNEKYPTKMNGTDDEKILNDFQKKIF